MELSKKFKGYLVNWLQVSLSSVNLPTGQFVDQTICLRDNKKEQRERIRIRLYLTSGKFQNFKTLKLKSNISNIEILKFQIISNCF